MNPRHFAITAALVLMLQACASSGPQSGYEGRPGDSRAYKIARAAGIDDVRDVKLPASENPSTAAPGLLNSPVAGGLVGALAPAAGLTALSGGALGLLSGMTADTATPSRLLAWVPTTLAPTPDAAADVVVQHVLAADIPGIWNQTVPDAEMFGPIESSDHQDWRFPIKHPQCKSENSCQFWLSELRYLYKSNVFPAKSEPQVTSNFIVMNFPGNSYYSDSMGNPARAVFPDFDVIVKISKKLPRWAYLYIPAGGAGFQKDDGKITFVPFPFILHQGEILYFAKNQ